MCVYLHFHLRTSGLDPTDEKFGQALFIAHAILSLPFIFHESQNLLVSALTFNFLGFVSLSQTLNLIQKCFSLFNVLFRFCWGRNVMKNWEKKYLAQTILKTKVIFQLLETKGRWKMLIFHHYSPREKEKVGEWLVCVYDFANMILKSRCIIKVSESESCKYYSRLHQREACVSVGWEVVTNRGWGGFGSWTYSKCDIH